MTKLEQLETQLRSGGQFWRYDCRVEGATSDQAKIEIAQAVVNSGKPWAEGLAAEFASRQHPPGFNEDDN